MEHFVNKIKVQMRTYLDRHDTTKFTNKNKMILCSICFNVNKIVEKKKQQNHCRVLRSQIENYKISSSNTVQGDKESVRYSIQHTEIELYYR